MRAITLYQPYASLIALGAKKNETRSIPFKYRGPLLIHAAMKIPKHLLPLISQPPFSIYIQDQQLLPLGAIVAVCELYDEQDADEYVEDVAKMSKLADGKKRQMMAHELQFGNYESGRRVWRLRNVTAINPIKIAGSQGIWIPPLFVRENDEVKAAIRFFKSSSSNQK